MEGETTPFEAGDAAAVHALITANRAHLDRWLRWSAPIRTIADVEAMIERFQGKLAAGDGFHWGIRAGGALAGGVICWYINRDNRNAEVGYRITDRFVDHVVYGILDREWAA